MRPVSTRQPGLPQNIGLSTHQTLQSYLCGGTLTTEQSALESKFILQKEANAPVRVKSMSHMSND